MSNNQSVREEKEKMSCGDVNCKACSGGGIGAENHHFRTHGGGVMQRSDASSKAKPAYPYFYCIHDIPNDLRGAPGGLIYVENLSCKKNS